ncbi:MAG: YncE family protein, partial [Smithella sp.]
MKTTLLKALCLFCAVVIGSTAYAAAPGYHIIKKIQIGGEGGWDYLSIDSEARRLYVSRSTHVIVIDIDKDKIVGDIPDTPGVHGIAIASELGRGFISCGKSDTAIIFDLKTLKIIKEVKTGTNPDAILYEPAYKKVYTFNGKSNDARVFDAVSGKINAVIALGGKPEFAAADKKGKVYVNIEDTAEVAEIDG